MNNPPRAVYDCMIFWNDRHLTYLMRGDTAEGDDFRKRFPNIRILTPPEFLATLKR